MSTTTTTPNTEVSVRQYVCIVLLLIFTYGIDQFHCLNAEIETNDQDSNKPWVFKLSTQQSLVMHDKDVSTSISPAVLLQIKKCNIMLNEKQALEMCGKMVGKDWNCLINVNHDSLASPDNLPDVSFSCSKFAPLFCCPVWSTINCVLQLVQSDCDAGLVSQYKEYNYQLEITTLEQQQCANFTFDSNKCTEVFNFVEDTSKLESEAKQKGLYDYFFTDEKHLNDSYLPSYRSVESNGSFSALCRMKQLMPRCTTLIVFFMVSVLITLIWINSMGSISI